uniref:40S small subunit ribosomal protein uS14 n=1 Tax=Euglena gracilis TaxID=3039 RepID=A0A7L5NVP0_EUGGR|nr:40S small subunit ribosomal protein uS14 [Euglena gracilis]6ZJ3_SS Chain SS, Ribosomal protein uS14 [Euglena gracilis]
MGFKDIWRSHPGRGRGTRRCRISGNRHGIIRKYGLMMTRREFREIAGDIGFVKYN